MRAGLARILPRCPAMALRRRVAAAGFPLCALCAWAAPAWSAGPTGFALVPVAAGVYVHTGTVAEWQADNDGDVANLGVIVGERCVAVVDTGGSRHEAERFRVAITEITSLPVCFVINTHMHQDHVLGNAVFRESRPAPVFVAHLRLASSLSARQAFYRHALERDFGVQMPEGDIVYPSRTVDGTLELDLGGRTLSLRAWPTAHTDNDLTVYDNRTRTLFAGDLWFDQHLPVVDGSLRGWLKVLDDLAVIPAAVVVPGHGRVSTQWPAALRPESDYLRGVLDGVRRAIKAGSTIAQTVDALALDPSTGWRLGEEFHRRNVTAAYAELEWED